MIDCHLPRNAGECCRPFLSHGCILHLKEVWHILGVSTRNPPDRGYPWTFPVQEPYKLITALKRTKAAATDIRVNPAMGRTPTTVVFSPCLFLCITPTDVVWRKHEAILSTIELCSTEPADDVNDPAGFFLFHFFMPYVQHCYGNMYLMLYSLHLDIAYLVCFYSSFWSIASSYKPFWMPFLKGYTPWAADIERSTSYPHFLCFFPKIGLDLSLAISPWLTICSSLEYLSDAQVQSVCHWKKHVNSAPRTAYTPCLATLQKKVFLSLHTYMLIKPIIMPEINALS